MCSTPSEVYKGIIALRQNCLCAKPKLEEWHKQECLLNECQNCGVEKLHLCPYELVRSPDYKMSWKHFETKVIG
jgi:hypothetical protein